MKGVVLAGGTGSRLDPLTRITNKRFAQIVVWYRERRDWWEPLKSGEYADYSKRQYERRLS